MILYGGHAQLLLQYIQEYSFASHFEKNLDIFFKNCFVPIISRICSNGQ